MKILHITTYDHGGAGLCCVRLHKGLLAAGYNSKVLVLHKTFNEPEVYRFEQKKSHLPKIFRWFRLFVELIMCKLRIPISKVQYYQYKLDALQHKNPAEYTLPLSEYNLSSNKLVQEADIIHLHWVAKFLDYPSFFMENKKPLIWTLHDENIFFGGFHYRVAYNENKTIYQRLERDLVYIKQHCLSKCQKITFVLLSRMMEIQSLSSEIIQKNIRQVIPNSVDPIIFKPLNKDFCRDIFGLPKDKKIILFVSYHIDDKRKGLKELISAAELMQDDDVIICTIGFKLAEIQSSVKIFYLDLINDPRLLSLAYSSADIFSMPSFQEAFAQSPLEAMACGLPVVAFPCSGTEELINENNGVRTHDFTVEALKEGILKALKTDYDKEWIRKDVIDRFGVKHIVDQYIQVYEDTLNNVKQFSKSK